MAQKRGTNSIHGNIVMLDLSSPEVNRGSFCYLTYILHSAFTTTHLYPQIKNVLLHEEFCISQLEAMQNDIDNADFVLVGLWSYPQIDAALMLHRFLKGRCYFYGYYPLIDQLGLNKLQYINQDIVDGIRNYPDKVCRKVYQYDLLSDCDKHLKDNAKRTVSGIEEKMVPFFTSYGCPMGCSFCSATVNCNKERIELGTHDVLLALDTFSRHGRTSIHLTDEDFFINPKRTAHILLSAYGMDTRFQFIALGGMKTVEAFCDHVAHLSTVEQEAIWHVLRLVEIGLETVDPAVAKAMGKQGRSSAENAIRVKSKVGCPVLWLAVTFFPGETIGSLNATGAFLKEHGFTPEYLVERIVTNGTEGGLGQFFQYYEGAGMTMREYEAAGVVLTARPMRLIPSFIPHSFLNSAFKIDLDAWEDQYDDLIYWLGVYGVDKLPEPLVHLIAAVKKPVYEQVQTEVQHILAKDDLMSYMNSCVTVAIMARLNILKAV